MARPSSTHDAPVIQPGATLGILGNGQLGRMFAIAAARLGYRVHVYSPKRSGPASQVSEFETVADYEDSEALARFAQSVAVVTLEFENIPAAAVELLENWVPVRPSAAVLHITQNRLREKQFLNGIGIPTAPFAEVTTESQLTAAIESVGFPAILKTADSGYDGKGQAKFASAEEATIAWNAINRQPAIVEGMVDFQQELSVLVARSPCGEVVSCGPIANDHVNHILDVSQFPAEQLDEVAQPARAMCLTIAEELGVVGICCVELFLTRAGDLLVNEIAPRPHNSGHLTIEACRASQFEQQVRAICNLPLVPTEVISPAAMVNLLGDLWQSGEPKWPAVLSSPSVRLHLYGKREAQPGRKMGHLTALASSASEAAEIALNARKALK